MAHAEKIVYDLEALVAGWEVDSRDVNNLGIFRRGVLFEENESGYDACRGDVDGQFVFPDGELLNIFW